MGTAQNLSLDHQNHFRSYRVKCRNVGCGKDFCRLCWEQPYHLGESCESLKASKSAAKCRFCGVILSESNRLQNPPSKALTDVCSAKACVEKMRVASDKTLKCGHLCLGVRNEPTQMPCLVAGCPDQSKQCTAVSTDTCAMCGIEPLAQAPCVIMPCNHVFHYLCIRKKVKMGWPKAYISFEFSFCPICKMPMEHPKLADIVDPLRSLEMILREKALKRLKYEGRDKDDGGAKECGAEDANQEEVDKKELICGKCQKIESIDECKEHGEEYLAYKCRYCCTMSVFHCWGKVHFC